MTFGYGGWDAHYGAGRVNALPCTSRPQHSSLAAPRGTASRATTRWGRRGHITLADDDPTVHLPRR